MKNLEQNIAQRLLQINAIKLSPQNPFTWASGIKSPIYCDNRVTLSYPDIRKEIKEGFASIASQMGEYDHVSGVATAGIAHGALLADHLDLPFSYVRSSAKQHGRKNKIEGHIEQGSKVLVIEDLISTGGSSILAVEDLRAAGHEVVGVLAIFTYEFAQAVKNFEDADCPFATLSGYTTLLSEATKNEYITMEESQVLAQWSQDPKAWFDQNF